jgi:hypothetical protein
MSDFFPDDDTENIWHMTDEARASYCRWRDGLEDVDSGPQLPCTPPKGVYPTREPRIDTQRSSAPLSEAEEDLDFLPGCEVKNCTHAIHSYIAYHPVDGSCVHPAYASEGRLLHRLVCLGHLRAYERKAKKAFGELEAPWYVKLFRDTIPQCPGCGRPIVHDGDILQIAKEIW